VVGSRLDVYQGESIKDITKITAFKEKIQARVLQDKFDTTIKIGD
jgi:hypothetical protein